MQRAARSRAASGYDTVGGAERGLAAAVLRHRSESARVAELRAREQGDGVSDRAGGVEDRDRQDAGPDTERRDA